MSKTNELNNIDRNVYNQLVSNIDIKGIYLKRLITSDIELPIDKNINCKVELKYNCNDYKFINKNIIEFYPKFKVEMNIEGIPPVLIQFDFRLVYKLKDVDTYTDEYINFFMEKNVPINVWPYARETISSITTRMGYPPLIISPFKG